MFVEFNYANMSFDSTLRYLTSLGLASLRSGTSLIAVCSQCQNFY
jgi:hypothetical protein